MTAETGTRKTGAIHKYYKCYGKKKKIKDCTKHNVRKEDIDFFNNFILRVNLYDNKITIVYNTSLNPSKEVYFKDDNKPDDNSNGGGTTIYSTELDLTENNEKSRPNSNEFKRQFLGGE